MLGVGKMLPDFSPFFEVLTRERMSVVVRFVRSFVCRRLSRLLADATPPPCDLRIFEFRPKIRRLAGWLTLEREGAHRTYASERGAFFPTPLQ